MKIAERISRQSLRSFPQPFFPPRGIPLRKMKQEKRRTQDQQVFFFTLHSTSRFPASWKAQHTTKGEVISREDAFIVNVCIFLRFVSVKRERRKRRRRFKYKRFGRNCGPGTGGFFLGVVWIRSVFIAVPITGFGLVTVKSRFITSNKILIYTFAFFL